MRASLTVTIVHRDCGLRPLVGQLIVRLSKYDTNPANSPQPPEGFRK